MGATKYFTFSPQLFSQKPTGQVVLPRFSKEESEAQKGPFSGTLELDLNAGTALSGPRVGCYWCSVEPQSPTCL